MTTSSQVSDQWEAFVMLDDEMQAITEKYYMFAVTEDSEFEIERLYFNKQINFWQVLIARGHERLETQRLDQQFIVEASYFKSKTQDTSGANWRAVRDAMETIFDTVRADLGESWGSTIDFWRPQEGPPEIGEVLLAGEKVWRGTYRFFGTKILSL